MYKKEIYCERDLGREVIVEGVANVKVDVVLSAVR